MTERTVVLWTPFFSQLYMISKSYSFVSYLCMCICAYYQGYFLVKTSLKNQGDTSAFFRSRVSKYTDRPKCNVGGCVIICRYLWSPLWRRRTNVYKFQPHLKLKFLSSHSHIGLKIQNSHYMGGKDKGSHQKPILQLFNIVQTRV